MHSAGIIHRDLKPRNLLINSNCDLKICDFGLSRAIIPYLVTSTAQITDYMTTRWYRAPEIILSKQHYDGKSDVWSVGCIIPELVTGKPLMPAQNSQAQMQKINDLIGSCSEDFIEDIDDADNKSFMQGLPTRQKADLNERIPGASPECLDLISKMLVMDPAKRISVAEALDHPFLAAYKQPNEPCEEKYMDPFDFDFELYSLSADEYKKLIYEEIQLYHDEQAVAKYLKDRQEHPNGILY